MQEHGNQDSFLNENYLFLQNGHSARFFDRKAVIFTN